MKNEISFNYLLLCQMWNEFFDDMLNPKGEEKSRLPSLLKWREKFTKLFDQVKEEYNLIFLIYEIKNFLV